MNSGRIVWRIDEQQVGSFRHLICFNWKWSLSPQPATFVLSSSLILFHLKKIDFDLIDLLLNRRRLRLIGDDCIDSATARLWKKRLEINGLLQCGRVYWVLIEPALTFECMGLGFVWSVFKFWRSVLFPFVLLFSSSPSPSPSSFSSKWMFVIDEMASH